MRTSKIVLKWFRLKFPSSRIAPNSCYHSFSETNFKSLKNSIKFYRPLISKLKKQCLPSPLIPWRQLKQNTEFKRNWLSSPSVLTIWNKSFRLTLLSILNSKIWKRPLNLKVLFKQLTKVNWATLLKSKLNSTSSSPRLTLLSIQKLTPF